MLRMVSHFACEAVGCSSGLGRVFLQIAPQRVSRRGIPRYGGAKSGHVGQEQGQPERPTLADTVNLQVPIPGNQPRLDGLDFGPIQTMVDERVVSAANPVRIDVPATHPNGQADWQQQCPRNPGQAEQDIRRGGEVAPDNGEGHAQSRKQCQRC
ncbi:MAG: hypothetical protein ACJ8CB_36695 [Ktedonobacteraceae bacterium]